MAAQQPQPYWLANTQPSSGDDMVVRNAMHQQASGVSDRLYAALQSLLHGSPPTLNFVSGGSPLLEVPTGASATPATNTVNLSPRYIASLINPADGFHDWAVQGLPHELAHLRQSPDVLASTGAAEGGAQAFTDLVTPAAAKQAGVQFDPGQPGYYDANYAQYVKNVMDQLGKSWVLYSEFGHQPS